MPEYKYKCPKCGKTYHRTCSVRERDEVQVCWCYVKLERQVTAIGGYKIKGDNSASVTPKQAGSFKKQD